MRRQKSFPSSNMNLLFPMVGKELDSVDGFGNPKQFFFIFYGKSITLMESALFTTNWIPSLNCDSGNL